MKTEAIYNVIVTEKVEESAEFYMKLFGLEKVADLDWYVHLKGPDGNTEIAFMEPDHPSQPEIFKGGRIDSGIILSFQVDDIKAYMERAKELAIEVLFELKEEEWGQVHFGIRDPNGIPIDIVKHVEG